MSKPKSSQASVSVQKIKIFTAGDRLNGFPHLEKQMNAWLKRNPRIKILEQSMAVATGKSATRAVQGNDDGAFVNVTIALRYRTTIDDRLKSPFRKALHQKLDVKIDVNGAHPILSMRTRHALTSLRPRFNGYVGELVQLFPADLLSARNLGQKSLREVRIFLDEMGLLLETPQEELMGWVPPIPVAT